jgi:anti-sigma B factor antagonist
VACGSSCRFFAAIWSGSSGVACDHADRPLEIALAEPLGSLSVVVHDDVCVATLSGEIDLSNRDLVAQQLDAAVEDGLELVVDLEPLRYLDSAGIRMLFELQDRLVERGRTLRLVATPDLVVWRVLTLTGLTATVPSHRTVRDAVQAAAAPVN